MIQLNLTVLSRARLWEPAELPSLLGPPVAEEVLEAALDVDASKSVIIEVAVPRGGVTSYGLLGAKFEPAHGASLAMSVLSDGDRSFSNALARFPERVEFGLPSEYVSSVVSGFLSGARQFADVPAGRLVFSHAAHGKLGSSGELFRELATCITRLALGAATPWDVALREELGL
jgi:hypothetical protein